MYMKLEFSTYILHTYMFESIQFVLILSYNVKLTLPILNTLIIQVYTSVILRHRCGMTSTSSSVRIWSLATAYTFCYIVCTQWHHYFQNKSFATAIRLIGSVPIHLAIVVSLTSWHVQFWPCLIHYLPYPLAVSRWLRIYGYL